MRNLKTDNATRVHAEKKEKMEKREKEVLAWSIRLIYSKLISP